MEDYPENVQGFKVMKLRFSEESQGVHHMLWKRHNVRIYNKLKPPERTLFVVNVPSYCNEASFKRLFQVFGDVADVLFSKKPSSDGSGKPAYPHFSHIESVEGFKVAYVVFSEEVSLKRAMAASSSKELILSTSDHRVATGLQKWRQEYNQQYVNPDELSEEIKTVMVDYEKKKEEMENASKEEEADEDGWITVTSDKKKKPKLLKANEFKKQTKRKKKKQVELVKFYAFQHRQAKIDKLAHLRKRFEEDKKRINMMKASRKFRP